MKPIVELNGTNFDETMETAKQPVVVDFYAPWCGPCQMLVPLLEKIAEHFAGQLQLFKVNVDNGAELAERFEITGVPTLLFFKNGQLCDRMVGFASPRELAEKLNALASAKVEVGA